jgi:hypothetical protein
MHVTLPYTCSKARAGQLIGGKVEKLRHAHAAAQAEALRNGGIAPDDTPFLCSVLKVLANPWGALEGAALDGNAPVATGFKAAQCGGGGKLGIVQGRGEGSGIRNGGVRPALPARKRGACGDEVSGSGNGATSKRVALWVS